MLCGREKVLEILEDGINPITFNEYPRNAEWILNARERINKQIKKYADKR